MTDARYCNHCAELIDPSMSYCPSCGGEIRWVHRDSSPRPKPPTRDAEQAERDRKKAEALAGLKADWWKTLIALVVVVYFVFHWIG